MEMELVWRNRGLKEGGGERKWNWFIIVNNIIININKLVYYICIEFLKK